MILPIGANVISHLGYHQLHWHIDAIGNLEIDFIGILSNKIFMVFKGL